MIFYFSGTGNSQWVATQLAQAFDESLIPIGDHLKKPLFELQDNEKIGFCFPIHSWGIPSIVVKFIKTLQLNNYQHQQIFAVATCGDTCGLSQQQFLKLIEQKGWQCRHFYSVQMPNNYICLPGFNIDSLEQQSSKIAQTQQVLPNIISAIQADQPFSYYFKGNWSWFKSKVIYPGFCKNISDKLFYTTEQCSGCGACERFCPTRNIVMLNGKPQWKGDCTQCLSCIHRCPYQAIQYGRQTLKKGRYHFSEELIHH